MSRPRAVALVICGLVAARAVGAETPPTYLLSWGSPGTGAGQFDQPFALAVDGAGFVYVADKGNNRIQKFTGNGAFVTMWGTPGSGQGQFQSPFGVAVDTPGNVYVSDSGNYRVQKFASDGTFLREWGSNGSADGQFIGPGAVACDASGKVYVMDRGNLRVDRFTADGVFITSWGSNASPAGIATDLSQHVFVAEPCYVVTRFTDEGVFIGDCGMAGYVECANPGGLATDSGGNVYLVKPDLSRVAKFDPNGTLLVEWGAPSQGGPLSLPAGIAVDGAGNIFVSDLDDQILKFAPSVTPVSRATWGRVKVVYR